MMDYTLGELELWNGRIEAIAAREGLDCYQQEFEICSYDDMLCYESYMGMPAHYPHWSYGKSYEKNRTLYAYNLSGLPYEMVINSDPCIAYLMRDNTLLLQILTMAHVYGHNDFFKNNRLFKQGTRAEFVVQMFKTHADRIRSYIQDPGIGYERVERILDAAHAMRYQTERVIGTRQVSPEEKQKQLLKQYYRQTAERSPLDEKKEVPFPNLGKVPLEPTDDIMLFLIEHSKMDDWEKDILRIVHEETQYFIPQIETKIMNEGWASYWHYRILKRLVLSQGLHMEFLNRHNQVIRPFLGGINPYYVGFKIFEDIERVYGTEKIFEVRRMERDASFLRRYLTEDLCKEMHLFQYNRKDKHYEIEKVSDENEWQDIRDTLANMAGMGGIPCIKVTEVSPRDNALFLEHQYDGRELEMSYAQETLKYLGILWNGKIHMKTVINGKHSTILCDEDRRISSSAL